MNSLTLYGYPEYHEAIDEPGAHKDDLFGDRCHFLFADGYEPTPLMVKEKGQKELLPLSAIVKDMFLQKTPNLKHKRSPLLEDHLNYPIMSPLLFLPGYEEANGNTSLTLGSETAMLYQVVPSGADFVLEY
jgi:hypothetical protein